MMAICPMVSPFCSRNSFAMLRLLVLLLIFSVTRVAGLACPAPMRLKQLLQSEIDGTRDDDKPIMLPCCYDGLTARLVTRAGFDATFMTGFGVSGTWLMIKRTTEIRSVD